MSISLVVMAAGLGSRYGGNKQVEGIGPNHEMLMEYSIFDAVRAGFDQIVFIIKPDMQPLIEKLCGELIHSCKTVSGASLSVRYAVQDYTTLPAYFSVPENRVKPYGTVHAVLCAEKMVDGPFAVINADDYYGVEAYKVMYDALADIQPDRALMVGYSLKNTVSKNGAVTRGICTVKENRLEAIQETYQIQLMPDGSICDTSDAAYPVPLCPDSTVSMNMWGFHPCVFTEMNAYFDNFLKNLPENELKKECLLPVMVDALMRKGEMNVSVLHTQAFWFGMTYPEDKPTVQQALLELHKQGVYPEKLSL